MINIIYLNNITSSISVTFKFRIFYLYNIGFLNYHIIKFSHFQILFTPNPPGVLPH